MIGLVPRMLAQRCSHSEPHKPRRFLAVLAANPHINVVGKAEIVNRPERPPPGSSGAEFERWMAAYWEACILEALAELKAERESDSPRLHPAKSEPPR